MPKYIHETYKVSGKLVSTVSLNNDFTHALNISKWTPTITEVETKHTSDIEYEGTIEDS